MDLLKFSQPNSKLKALKKQGIRIMTFSIPSGWTCPAALSCKVKVDRVTGKITDGAHLIFRCFSASQENTYKDTRAQRWHNFDLLKPLNQSDMINLIETSLPKNANTIRIHVAGDFFNTEYFLTWCAVAQRNPSILFYAYTKSLNIWAQNLESVPTNLVLTASKGGRYDKLIAQYGLKSARVVFSLQEAITEGLEIDHDDTHAMDITCKEFALLVHGTQPSKSAASRAKVALKGLGSYSDKQKVNESRAQLIDSLV